MRRDLPGSGYRCKANERVQADGFVTAEIRLSRYFNRATKSSISCFREGSNSAIVLAMAVAFCFSPSLAQTCAKRQ